jgi:hypothetical protein
MLEQRETHESLNTTVKYDKKISSQIIGLCFNAEKWSLLFSGSKNSLENEIVVSEDSLWTCLDN